jgi:hypothetical protein
MGSRLADDKDLMPSSPIDGFLRYPRRAAAATRTQKVLPCPGALTTPILPPINFGKVAGYRCSEARPRQICALPSCRLVRSARKQSLLLIKRNADSSIDYLEADASRSAAVTRKVTPPDAVNLNALFSRLPSTWERCVGSPITAGGYPGSTWRDQAMPFTALCGRTIAPSCCTKYQRLKQPLFRSLGAGLEL